jgi:hypothetical protein
MAKVLWYLIPCFVMDGDQIVVVNCHRGIPNEKVVPHVVRVFCNFFHVVVMCRVKP